MLRYRVLLGVCLSFLISSCSSTQANYTQKDSTIDKCSSGENFCYKGINFGISRGKLYEKGIIDGCTTGEGKFTKNYSLSSSSKDYFDGWIVGRSKCKQILPNEGTKQEEENSRKRAEYQIRKLKMEQQQKELEKRQERLEVGYQEATYQDEEALLNAIIEGEKQEDAVTEY
jgi:hypothetical protein